MKNSAELKTSLTYTNNDSTLGEGNDFVGYPVTDEEQDEHNFVKILIGCGYDRDKVETTYKTMKEIVNLYNIPLSLVLADVIQNMNFETVKKSQEELMDIWIKCVDAMVGMFQNVTDNIRIKLKENGALQ